jgi:hypothetical protein
MLLYTWII